MNAAALKVVEVTAVALGVVEVTFVASIVVEVTVVAQSGEHRWCCNTSTQGDDANQLHDSTQPSVHVLSCTHTRITLFLFLYT